MAAHRYWRVRNIFNRTNQTGIGTIEMAATTGGTNLCTGGTVFATGSYGGGYSPGSAFDGNVNSNWFQSGSGGDRWIGYDFGSGVEHEINELRMGPGSEDIAGYPRMFHLESSDDDVTYTLEWIGGGDNVASSTVYSYPRPVVFSSARYWMLMVEKSTIGAVCDVVMAEMELLQGGADQTGSGAASSYRGVPANAFDNDTVTYWYWNHTTEIALLQYDLGSAIALDQFSMQAVVSDVFNNHLRMPEDATLYASEGGRSWTSMKVLVDEPAWGSLEKRTYDLDGGGGGGSPVRRRMIVVT